MSIKEMVKDGKVVRFVRYAKGALWYATEDGFEFPVPISDTNEATFEARDKAMLFMRWIRKHLAEVEQLEQEAAQARASVEAQTQE